MPLEDEIALCSLPPSRSADALSRKPPLIYFIPGNPGLIEYYRSFLLHVAAILEKDNEGLYSIYGSSLAGYQLRHDKLRHLPPPHDLEQQGVWIRENISKAVRARHQCYTEDSEGAGNPERVILVGHSVGAWLMMQHLADKQARSPAKCGCASGLDEDYEIVGAIGLFPTVFDIAKSPLGRKVAPFVLHQNFALVVHLLVKALFFLVPIWLLARIVTLVNGFPFDAARITATFLKSRHGVRQALFLGRDELQRITSDPWSDSVWGSSSTTPTEAIESAAHATETPSLYFYFGENDHWIANSTRDKIIATRGRRQTGDGSYGRTTMEIDVGKVPHDFCIRHSRPIAEKVAEYVRDSVANLR